MNNYLCFDVSEIIASNLILAIMRSKDYKNNQLITFHHSTSNTAWLSLPMWEAIEDTQWYQRREMNNFDYLNFISLIKTNSNHTCQKHGFL